MIAFSVISRKGFCTYIYMSPSLYTVVFKEKHKVIMVCVRSHLQVLGSHPHININFTVLPQRQ